MKNELFDYLKDKKILILGFGREGLSTYNFIRSIDRDIKLSISDINDNYSDEIKNDVNTVLYSGDNYLDVCNDYEVIIKGPGVIIKNMLSDEIKKRITCQTDLFLRFCTNKTIGVTGTKGKSTTSSLLYHLINKQYPNSLLMGNIGVPCFDMIGKIDSDTICILELGVHQLEYMRSSSNISVVLNIYEEHLDHYNSFQDYIDAKKNIYLYQDNSDYVLLGDSPYLNDKVNSRCLVNREEDNDCFYIDGDELVIIRDNNRLIISKDDIKTKLVGEHNLSNILFCLTIISILGFNIEKAISDISSFSGLPHRLQYFGTYNDIKFYDDTIATSVPSVISGVEALKEVDTIIIGGMDRGIDYKDLVTFLDNSDISNIILLSETSKRIKVLFDSITSSKNILMARDMEEAVDYSFNFTKKNKICLLSPAAASYGDYKNFEEKGDHFQKLVSSYTDCE